MSRVFLLVLISITNIQAQEMLLLESVLEMAATQNPQIQSAGILVEIAENNEDPGVSGLYPRLSATGSGGYSNNNTRLEFAQASQAPIEVEGAQSYTYSAGIGMTYTLFDGLGNVYTLRQRQLEHNRSLVDFQITFEGVMSTCINQYYEVARLQLLNNINSENLDISLDRFNREEIRAEMGTSSSFDLLSAKVDLSNDSLSTVQSQTELRLAKRNLNRTIGRSAEIDFEANTEVELAVMPEVDVLLLEAENSNAALSRARQESRISEYANKAAGSEFWPQLDLNAGYNYNAQENEVGLLLFNQTRGANAGLNLRWDLFNGNVNYIRKANAKLNIENANIQLADQELGLRQQVMNAKDLHQNALFSLQIANRNVKTADLSFTRATELYNLGQIDNTQFREAQLNKAQAENKKNNAAFIAKLAETELKRLTGQLFTLVTAEE